MTNIKINIVLLNGVSLDYFKSILIMRGNSIGLKRPVFRPLIIEKSNMVTRPSTRSTSFQPRPLRGYTKTK